MGFFSALVGGVVGFLVGGPVGAVIGAGIGATKVGVTIATIHAIPKDAEVPPGVDNCRAKMDKAIEKSDLPELAAVEACVIELKRAILGA
jgi:hypothetical protein